MSSKKFSPVSDDSSAPVFEQPTLLLLLQESLNREKHLKRQLDEQLKKNDSLQLELEMERKKSQVNFKSISDVSEESELHVQASSLNDADLIETFGTNSSMLMQFRYDELRVSYRKSVQKLVKKTKQLRKVLREAEIGKFINIQLNDTNQELNKKIELVCFRYFDLMDRRSEELTVHRSLIDELKRKIMFANLKLERHK